jgi:hypothetical protein
MRFKRLVFSTFLLGLGIYILLPTPDELIIHPVLGFFFSYLLGINIIYGLLLSALFYRIFGSACVFGAIVLGGKPSYLQFKERMRLKKLRRAL